MTPEPSLVGQIIYGYRVEEAIGTGSQGDIYRLKHPTLPDKYLALKVLRGENAASHELRSRFLQDAMAAAKVGTVGVVQPVQIDELADGTPYIVMELAPGISLDKDLLANGPLSVSAAVQIASAVASTVAQVHGHGIIHRDLKPGNLMVDRDGDDIRSVKLLDFGVAQVTGDLKRVKTAKGQFFGTRFYIAPETSSGDAIDGRVDVFSLGVVLYEMLTGDTPFPGLFETLSPDPAPPASAKRPAHLDPVPVTVERLLEGALAKRAALRFTMDRLRDELARAVEELRAMGRRGSTLKRMGVAVGETPDNYTPRSVARVPGSEPSGRLSPSLSGPRPVIALASPPPRRSPDPEAPLATGRIDPIRGPTRGPQSGPQGGTVDPPDTAPTEKLEMIILPPGAELARLEPNASAPEPVLPVKRAPSANIGTQRMDPLPAAPGKPPLAAPAPPRTETWQVLSPRQAKRLRSRAILALAVAVAGGLGAAGLVWLLRDRKPALRSVPFAAVVPSTAPPDAAAPPPEKPRPAPPPEAASAVAKPEVEPSWSALDPGTTNALFDVWGDARGSVYAVGEAGTILHSTDAGRSFRDLSYQPESGRPPTLYGVWSDGKDVWVVGDRGTILHGRGDAWTVQGRPSATVYYGVWGSSRDDLHIAGNPSTILHSSDGGATWERREAHSGNGLRRVWGSGPRDAWAVGWGETILHSTDGGKSWKLARSGRSTTLFDIWGSSASDVYAVGSLHPPGSRTRSADDAILHTSDGGKHWERQKSGTRYPLYAIGGSGPEDVYAAGPATLLLRSDDGTSWNKVDLDVKRRKVSRIFASGDAIYVVGMGGLMLRRGK